MNAIHQRRAVAKLALLAGVAIMALPARALQTPVEPPQGQDGPPPQGPPQRGPGRRGPGPEGPGARDSRPDSPSAELHMPPGRWWNDPDIAQSVGLSAAQIKRMDETFDGARDHLIDLDAAVRKAEGGPAIVARYRPDRSWQGDGAGRKVDAGEVRAGEGRRADAARYPSAVNA